jgi:hypothetical protein
MRSNATAKVDARDRLAGSDGFASRSTGHDRGGQFVRAITPIGQIGSLPYKISKSAAK